MVMVEDRNLAWLYTRVQDQRISILKQSYPEQNFGPKSLHEGSGLNFEAMKWCCEGIIVPSNVGGPQLSK